MTILAPHDLSLDEVDYGNHRLSDGNGCIIVDDDAKDQESRAARNEKMLCTGAETCFKLFSER